MPREIAEKFNDPETAVKDDGRSIGLHNAFARMRIYYGGGVSWDVSSIQDMGTIITLEDSHTGVYGAERGDEIMRIVIVEDEIKIREGMGKLIESQTKHIVLGKLPTGRRGWR